MAFVVGGPVGAFLYALTYPLWSASGIIDGEKLTTGVIDGSGAEGLLALPGQIVRLVLGLVLAGIAIVLPRFPLGAPSTPAVATEDAETLV